MFDIVDWLKEADMCIPASCCTQLFFRNKVGRNTKQKSKEMPALRIQESTWHTTIVLMSTKVTKTKRSKKE